jgi:NAD(P)-dependent dehydrogenase (short-subunit alcohol dehydrogenase family)
MLGNLAEKFSGDMQAGLALLGQMAPQGRIGTAVEAAGTAAFLMSDDATYITGQAIAVDGGILAGIGGRG